ncbi:unnamed protein product [Sphagnum troendelagicum]|uniref:Uncharacterized protein n=1 Tax=Sphagnum troendelagicum TaxID=128251 RepID=A0ABP0UYD2_9BRYO
MDEKINYFHLMQLFFSGNGLEEMRHLLMCATLELDSARAVASAEVELHDAQVRHLQELLAAAQRERDEAREQYLGLQGCLSRSPSTNAGRGTAGSTTLGRRSRDHQSHQQQLPNSALSGVMSPAASTVQQEVVQQQQQQFDMEQLQKHLEILQDDEQHLEIFQDEHLVDHLEDLADLDSMLQQIPQEQTDHTNALQNRSTHEQYFHHEPCAVDDARSDELLSHCIRQEQQMQVQLQSADQQVMSSSLMEQQQQQQVQHQQGDMSVQLQQSPWPQSLSSGPSPAAGFSPAAAAVLCSSAVVSPQLLPSCLPAPPAALFQTAAGSPVSSLLGTGSTGLAVSMQQQQQRSGAPASVQQLLPCKHVLPEPPEADLQVMLSSLPEKGKLMQAVMDAGPLLQTLLMASSSPQLPQWRHPPPGLESLQLPITNSSCATDPNMSTTTLQGGNKYGVHRQLQRLSSFSSSYPISNNSISNNNSSSSSSMSSPSAAAAAVSGFMSSNVNHHLRRVNSMGHLMSPEMALTNQPRKYTKIY